MASAFHSLGSRAFLRIDHSVRREFGIRDNARASCVTARMFSRSRRIPSSFRSTSVISLAPIPGTPYSQALRAVSVARRKFRGIFANRLLPTGQSPCRNSIRARFTASGLSCCVQWPTPGRISFLRKFGTLRSIASTSSPQKPRTPSRSPAIKRVG